MSQNQDSHQIRIAQHTRELPLFEVAPGLKIAVFNMLGDTEITVAAAQELHKKIPQQVEVLVTPEVKSVPLTAELSRITHLPYIVVRKIKKPYMGNALSATVRTYTHGNKKQKIWLDERDVHKIDNKKVALVDDVISTGSTFSNLESLMKQANAEVVCKMVVFTEGDKDKWSHIISLGHLPLFKESSDKE